MFETAETGRKLSKSDYDAEVPDLRTALLTAQRALEEADFPVLIVLNGFDGAGKLDTLNLLHEWLDARYMMTSAFSQPTEEEAHRPDWWRYWMALPPRGQIGIFSESFYASAMLDRLYDRCSDEQLGTRLVEINAFEKALVDDGALIIKFWFHISKKGQKEHLEKLEGNPDTRWRITKTDWKHHKLYKPYRSIAERTVRETSTGEAPWMVIEGTDERYRNVATAKHILSSIRARLGRPTVRAERRRQSAVFADPATILDTLDLSKAISKPDYKHRLEQLQGRLFKLSQKVRKKERSVIMVFEGWDAAGKGGSIRRVIHALDARQYRVIPIAAPTDEEQAHHYLWRFWRHLPRRGRFTIFDRSWYGRVLVERVEGFALEQEWKRAFKEVNDFEHQLVDSGIILLKFWMHISQGEQLRRFEERERIAWKKHKITDEDYRNRDKANHYEAAANEMVGRTSTEYAPWTLVEAESKHYGRIKVLEVVAEALTKAL